MPTRKRKSFVLADDEMRTIGFIVGIALLLYWGVGNFSPDNLVAGLVASLLIIQRALPTRKGHTDGSQDRRSTEEGVPSPPLPLDRDLDGDDDPLGGGNLRHLPLHTRPA